MAKVKKKKKVEATAVEVEATEPEEVETVEETKVEETPVEEVATEASEPAEVEPPAEEEKVVEPPKAPEPPKVEKPKQVVVQKVEKVEPEMVLMATQSCSPIIGKYRLNLVKGRKFKVVQWVGEDLLRSGVAQKV